ncbi:branched-chain amino acid transport system II carrier protein [Bacillus aerolatus]|uniref:Branched-chain amino acid transport system carrier protein n=1 Tax=Bacillus aerolatus TaxID=2653354 RepID=A0A6I1FEL3_9BACI|nr:branched-chain amino acid transport system II carrier protein [Bacillus aerolatus]KAB7706215.1 branched-chain amino acid transport system II carrier protein [Bacillus aerolatus]
MKKSTRDSLIFGFALFAIFFGAGNLIFPPSIGLASGESWGTAMAGFVLTGIILPILGIIAVLNAEGKFEVLTNPISPWFYKFFNIVVMVGIGMTITIPRTAATTHELGIHTLFPQIPAVATILVFFALNFYFAMDKSNFIDKVGKILTPALVVILVFIVAKGTFDPIEAPVATGLENPFSYSFINGYQTGDLLTGLLCASIFFASIAGKGYTKPADLRKITLNGTIIASVGLLVIYGGLLYIGATGSGLFPKDIDSTSLVIALVDKLLGTYGTIALAICVALACLTTSIGLTAAAADFLSNLTNNKINYRNFVVIICLAGTGVALLGVEKIIDYAMPLFIGIYPVSIVLVFLGVFRQLIPNAGAYKGAIIATFVISIFETLGMMGVKIDPVNELIALIPLSSSGFSWLVPSIIGFIVGALLHKYNPSGKENAKNRAS